MTDKRRDSRGRILRNGEVQRPDGRYMYRYTDMGGNRQTVYSWKLVETDAVPNGKQCKEALRDMEKRIQRDLEDHILTVNANTTTVDDLFGSFMRVRIDLKETTRCNYINLYHIHVSPTLGSAKLKAVKFSDIQKLYIAMMQKLGLKASTVHSVHAILHQLFETAVMDNVIRTNPCDNVLKSLRRKFDMEQEKRHALTVEEQEELIRYVYRSKRYDRLGTPCYVFDSIRSITFDHNKEELFLGPVHIRPKARLSGKSAHLSYMNRPWQKRRNGSPSTFQSSAPTYCVAH